jgi:hypothetical protein
VYFLSDRWIPASFLLEYSCTVLYCATYGSVGPCIRLCNACRLHEAVRCCRVVCWLHALPGAKNLLLGIYEIHIVSNAKTVFFPPNIKIQ